MSLRLMDVAPSALFPFPSVIHFSSLVPRSKINSCHGVCISASFEFKNYENVRILYPFIFSTIIIRNSTFLYRPQILKYTAANYSSPLLNALNSLLDSTKLQTFAEFRTLSSGSRGSSILEPSLSRRGQRWPRCGYAAGRKRRRDPPSSLSL